MTNEKDSAPRRGYRLIREIEGQQRSGTWDKLILEKYGRFSDSSRGIELERDWAAIDARYQEEVRVNKALKKKSAPPPMGRERLQLVVNAFASGAFIPDAIFNWLIDGLSAIANGDSAALAFDLQKGTAGSSGDGLRYEYAKTVWQAHLDGKAKGGNEHPLTSVRKAETKRSSAKKTAFEVAAEQWDVSAKTCSDAWDQYGRMVKTFTDDELLPGRPPPNI